eukprot:UN5112
MLAHKNKTLQDTLLADGAVETIFEAMQRYSGLDTSGYGGITTSDVWPCLPSSAQAMWCLMRDNPAVQSRMVEKGGILLFVRLMRAYPTDPRLLGFACAALGTLTQANQTYLVAIEQAGGAPTWCIPHLEGKASSVNIPDLESQIGRF